MKLTFRGYAALVLGVVLGHPIAAQVTPSNPNLIPPQKSGEGLESDQTPDLLKPLANLESIRSSSLGPEGGGEGASMGMPGASGMGMPGMGAAVGMGGMSGLPIVPSGKQLLLQQINELRQMLRERDQDRSELEPLLREALAEYFVIDMEERVREFDKIKARVAQMESKLQTRLDRRYDIVELQVKQIVHQADGLDFTIPNGPDGGYGSAGGMMGGMGGAMGGGMSGSGMSGSAMGPGTMGMVMGGADYGGESGSGMSSGPVNQLAGYDINFGMTRYLRFPGKALKPNDPLKPYAAMDSKSDRTNELARIAVGASDEEKMKSLLLAMYNFESIFKHLPATAGRRNRSEKPHSWRVALLPILGHASLYQQYHFDEPWDSENNRKLLEKMPAIFTSKEDSTAANGNTRFQMLIGNGAAFDTSGSTEFRDITDGTSNTVAIVAASTSVPWTKPEDVLFTPGAMLSKLDASRLVGMCDGSIRNLTEVNEKTLTILATRAGGEPTPP